MKKFFVFIVIVSLLIAAEYYFLTEIFTQKRVIMISVSAVVILACLLFLVRFFKRSFVSS